MTDLCTVYVTYPNEDTALSISKLLVQQKLVACANILPEIISLYEWKGEVVHETETAVLYKTDKCLFEPLNAYLNRHHPYDVVCCVLWSVEQSDPLYDQWVTQTINASDNNKN